MDGGDNEFGTAISKIIKFIFIYDDPVPINMDEIRHDFKCNGRIKWEGKKYAQYDEKATKRFPKFFSKFNKSSKKAQKSEKRPAHCRFCENNQEKPEVYKGHNLRDNTGRLTCPRLRNYVCPICFARGDDAHTVRYCTRKPIYMMQEGKRDIIKTRLNIYHTSTVQV